MRKLRVIVAIVTALPLLTLPLVDSRGAEEKAPGYGGTETCRACHADRYESFMRGSHGIKADPRTPAAKQGCETCHGPGLAHVQAGGGKGVGGIKALSPSSKIPARERNAVCLTCHSGGNRALWHGSTHDRKNVSCTDCHSIHSGNPKNLAKPTAKEVCFQCHKDVKAQTERMSHHPIREGKLTCTDCHNPHGTVTEKLINAPSVNQLCYKCHAEKRGPFLWEHPAVTESCLNCHTPHGSSHEKLLLAKRPYLCQRCHSGSRHPGTLYAESTAQAGQSVYSALNNRVYYRACSNCHSQIHGSNSPSGEFFLR